MKKEVLKLCHVREDLKQVASLRLSIVTSLPRFYIGEITCLSILVGIFMKSLWICLLIFAFAVDPIILSVKAKKAYREQKRALLGLLDRGDVAVSVERLSRVAEETVFEPYRRSRRTRYYKQVTLFRFDSGYEWRVPHYGTYYGWSPNYYLSLQGLKNISVPGNEFYFVSLQGHFEVSYIYPCKLFELGEDLRQARLPDGK